jgi:hypothetical protein
MVTEEHPTRGGDVVVPVGVRVRRRHAPIIEHECLGREKGAVVTIRQRENAEDGDDDG